MPQACNIVKKDTLAQLFSCEFCKISKTEFLLTEHLRWLLLQKQHTTNNKINSTYLGDKLFLKNVYVINVLAHWCVQKDQRIESKVSLFNRNKSKLSIKKFCVTLLQRTSVYFGISKLILYFPYFIYHVLYFSLCTFTL